MNEHSAALRARGHPAGSANQVCESDLPWIAGLLLALRSVFDNGAFTFAEAETHDEVRRALPPRRPISDVLRRVLGYEFGGFVLERVGERRVSTGRQRRDKSGPVRAIVSEWRVQAVEIQELAQAPARCEFRPILEELGQGWSLFVNDFERVMGGGR